MEKDPSPKTYELLGDAYMSIQEPTNAIEAYETAMRQNPKDHLLAEKIANAYVKCHLYNKVKLLFIIKIKIFNYLGNYILRSSNEKWTQKCNAHSFC